MRMRLECGCVRAVGRCGAVARQTDFSDGFDESGAVPGAAVDFVATKACHPALIHLTVDEVIGLHPVLVCGPFREMGERLLAGLVLFQLPKVLQFEALMKSDRPIIELPVERIGERLPLRVTLETGIIRPHKI